MPFVHRAALPFRRREAAGPNWVLLPSAAAFVDPLLSTGFPLTLLGLERLAGAIERSWGSPEFPSELSRIGRRTLDEADTAARLVAALYARMGEFPAFASLTLLYFAAASYAEAARRLGRPELSGAFLSGRPSGLRTRARPLLRARRHLGRRRGARSGRQGIDRALRRHRPLGRGPAQLVPGPGGRPARFKGETRGHAPGSRSDPARDVAAYIEWPISIFISAARPQRRRRKPWTDTGNEP